MGRDKKYREGGREGEGGKSLQKPLTTKQAKEKKKKEKERHKQKTQ